MKSLSFSLSTVALVAAGPAMAEITAEELWSIWQEQSAEFGYSLTAQATPDGSGLTLTDVRNAMQIEEVTVTGTIPRITMTNQPDGTVAVTVSDTMTYSITGIEGGDAPDAIHLDFRQTGLSVTASGDAQTLTLTTAFDQIALEDLRFIGVDPDEIPEMDYSMTLDGYATTATYDFTDPSLTGITSTATLAGFTLDLEAWEPGGGGGGGGAPTPQPLPEQPAPGKVVEPEAPAPSPAPTGGSSGDGHLELNIAMTDLEGNAEGTMPRGMNWMQMDTFPEGLDLRGEATYGSANASFAFEERSDMIDFAASNTGGRIGFGIAPDNLHYALSATGVQVNLAAADMPFPIAAAAESTAVAIDIPLAQTEDPAPFAASIGYRGVTVDESLWAMMDPTQAIPRTPATVVVDLTGTVQLFVDLMTMNPETMMMGPPGELRSLDLNELEVSLGGAELTGSGAVEFAPGQMMPMPVGSVDLSLTGANGLIQSLSDGGLLPPDQAGMARGMLGMFALPGANPDSYTSTVEFLPGGGITANGVPLQ